MRQGRGREPIFMRLWRSAQETPSLPREQQGAQRIPVGMPADIPAPTPQVPAPGGSPSGPALAPAPPRIAGAPTAAAPAAAPTAAAPAPAATAAQRQEEQAQTRYQIAMKLLDRQQIRPARAALQDILRRYPAAPAAQEARFLLAQIPEEPVAAPAPGRKSAAAVTGPAARNASPATAASPASPATPRRYDPIAEALAGRQRPNAQRPVIPESLLSAQDRGPGSSAAASSLDDVRVVSAAYQGTALAVTVEYVLASAHSRRVFLGAWMRSDSVSGRLGYTFVPLETGRGTAKLVLTGIPEGVSQLRVTFFEENGALFFTRDFNISK